MRHHKLPTEHEEITLMTEERVKQRMKYMEEKEARKRANEELTNKQKEEAKRVEKLEFKSVSIFSHTTIAKS